MRTTSPQFYLLCYRRTGPFLGQNPPQYNRPLSVSIKVCVFEWYDGFRDFKELIK